MQRQNYPVKVDVQPSINGPETRSTLAYMRVYCTFAIATRTDVHLNAN